MKSSLFFLSTILISELIAAQNYIPIPDTNATWNIQEQGFIPCGITDYQLNNHDMTVFISGDTIFNGDSYKKLYSTGHSYNTAINVPPFCTDNSSIYFNNVPYGAFRNDTSARKVWFIRYGYCNTPAVMFDFSLNVGDNLNSVSGCGSFLSGVVLADTFIVYGGVSRRVMIYKYNINGTTFETSTIIEGIGSLSAGLYDAYYHFEYNSSLICFAQNDTTVYPDNTISCELIMEVQEWAKRKMGFTVFPNPASNEINISSPETGEFELTIYNNIGLMVRSETIDIKYSGSKIILNYPAGIYLIQLTNGSGNYTQKLIIQNN